MNGPIQYEIRIAPYEYEIRFVENLRNGEGHDLYGEIDYPTGVIRISDEYRNSQRLPFVLWHEWLHGILEAAGHECDGDELVALEQIIRILAPGIVELIRNNRWVGEL